jgi:alkylated DNA nucleotide flippase Atl1
MRTPKTWREKLEIDKPRKVVDIPPHMERNIGKGKLLIPTPLDVDEQVRQIPKGRVMTTGELRAELAHKFGADTTCPMCTGMFLRIVAEASEERARNKTPYWRVISNEGKMNPKFPGGVVAQAAALRAEGHVIEAGRMKRN